MCWGCEGGGGVVVEGGGEGEISCIWFTKTLTTLSASPDFFFKPHQTDER